MVEAQLKCGQAPLNITANPGCLYGQRNEFGNHAGSLIGILFARNDCANVCSFYSSFT